MNRKGRGISETESPGFLRAFYHSGAVYAMPAITFPIRSIEAARVIINGRAVRRGPGPALQDQPGTLQCDPSVFPGHSDAAGIAQSCCTYIFISFSLSSLFACSRLSVHREACKHSLFL